MSDIGAPTAESAPPTRSRSSEQTSETQRAARTAGTGLYPPHRTGRSTRMIGEVVVDLGFADRETVDEAVEQARAQGRPTGLVLVEQGVLRHDQLARVVAERFGLDYVDLAVYDLDMGAVALLNAGRGQALPGGADRLHRRRHAAAGDGRPDERADDRRRGDDDRPPRAAGGGVGRGSQPAARAPGADGRLDRRHRRRRRARATTRSDLLVDEADSDAPIIKLVHSIVAQAVQQGASDIHVNPEEGDTRVLFRVDGVLAPAATVKRKMAMGVVSRIKIMADLDISEKRVPQDGRFALTVDGRRVDIRVVTLPLVYGEGVVLRILDKGVGDRRAWSRWACPSDALQQFGAAIKKPNGAVLVTGPTGSGKSTTLYAALNELNDGERSILTIEDPVEQRIAGHQADADRAEGGRDVRRGPALDAARRPRRDHGRRDPRRARPRTSRSRPR